eukprot:CFRG4604T1
MVERTTLGSVDNDAKVLALAQRLNTVLKLRSDSTLNHIDHCDFAFLRDVFEKIFGVMFNNTNSAASEARSMIIYLSECVLGRDLDHIVPSDVVTGIDQSISKCYLLEILWAITVAVLGGQRASSTAQSEVYNTATPLRKYKPTDSTSFESGAYTSHSPILMRKEPSLSHASRVSPLDFENDYSLSGYRYYPDNAAIGRSGNLYAEKDMHVENKNTNYRDSVESSSRLPPSPDPLTIHESSGRYWPTAPTMDVGANGVATRSTSGIEKPSFAPNDGIARRTVHSHSEGEGDNMDIVDEGIGVGRNAHTGVFARESAMPKSGYDKQMAAALRREQQRSTRQMKGMLREFRQANARFHRYKNEYLHDFGNRLSDAINKREENAISPHRTSFDDSFRRSKEVYYPDYRDSVQCNKNDNRGQESEWSDRIDNYEYPNHGTDVEKHKEAEELKKQIRQLQNSILNLARGCTPE